MILLINICKHELHTLEFVRPIEDVLKKEEAFFVTKHYSSITKKDLSDAHRIIICGTSLQDFSYETDIELFKKMDLPNLKKPILGICGGMQIICVIYGCKTSIGQEVGVVRANFMQEFLGVKGDKEIYSLHNLSVKEETLKKEFIVFAYTHLTNTSKKCIQAVKHNRNPHYGVLFHPEVRNKDMIVNFLRI